jgi:hypothetical protein
MKTIKETRVDKTLLRFVDAGKSIVGLAIVGDATKQRIEGATADEVWNRLHAEVGKTNQQYFGYAGARNRFLHFFPNCFHSNGYEASERDYKVATREKLLQTAPLADAVEGPDFGEEVPGDEPAAPLRKDPASRRASRPVRRPVHPGRGAVHAQPDHRRAARHGTGAEAS